MSAEVLKVVCIQKSWKSFQFLPFPLPTEGKVYTVEGIKQGVYSKNKQLAFYYLKEFPQKINGCRVSFCTVHFKPVEDSFADAFLENAIDEGKELEEQLLIPVELC